MSKRPRARPAPSQAPGTGDANRGAARLHMRFGWASLLVFLALGIGLEALHGLKVGWYLDVASSTRRLMFTLGHAHGTLLALVNIGYALSLRHFPGIGGRTASRWLIAGSLMMPAGFLLGGVVTYGGDPNPGVALVAVGGFVVLVAIAAVVHGLFRTE